MYNLHRVTNRMVVSQINISRPQGDIMSRIQRQALIPIISFGKLENKFEQNKFLSLNLQY